MKPMS